MKGSITAIVQARLGSTRLPNKVLADISGKPLIEHIIDRVSQSESIGSVILATTDHPSDDRLVDWAKTRQVQVFRGSETDVLARYYHSAVDCGAKVIARITADDPFKDPEVLDRVASIFFEKGLDFAYNNFPPSFPEGLDTEIFTFEALERAFQNANDPFEREHMTQHFYRNPTLFKQGNLAHSNDISSLRWTIDTEKDMAMAREVYGALYRQKRFFLMDDILALLKKRPEIATLNSDVTRSAMYAHLNK